jgi:hypothetical protein
MPKETKEPQSYGSGGDWVSGETGQKVHDPKAAPPSEHRDFYDERRESETTESYQGGRTSDFQLAENAQPSEGPSGEASQPAQNVTSTEGGAKHDSYFKKRDYE